MQKMVALYAIAGEDIFGRGYGHMSVSPIMTVVPDIHGFDIHGE